MKNYIVHFSSSSNDPHDALAAFTNAIEAVDFQSQLNGIDGMLDEKQLPIFMNGIQPEGEYSTHYRMEIYQSPLNISKILWQPHLPARKYDLEQTVRHTDTGLELFIRAIVWNHGNQEWYYVTAHFPDYNHPYEDLLPEIVQYSENVLMSAIEFDDFNHQLNLVTEKIWFMNQYINMFECIENKTRKMTMSDARHTINRFLNGEVVPF